MFPPRRLARHSPRESILLVRGEAVDSIREEADADAQRPGLRHCVEDLRNAGITDMGNILGNVMPAKVQEFLGDGSKFGVKLTYIIQGEPKGITHAVNCAREFMKDEPFIVYLGDNLLKNGIGAVPKKMVETRRRTARYR